MISRTLLRLLNESNDPVVLAVAAHDVGQYVKHYDRGKKWVLRSLDLTRFLKQLHHADS